MSPPHHISYSTLLPNTRLQVNTSAKPSEAYQYYRSPCHYLAIYLIFYSYLLQVYRSTRRQNLRSIPVLQVTMSSLHHISFSTTTYYRSTRRQNPQKHTSTTGHHVTTSPYILFSTPTYYRSTGQHVVKTLRSIPVLQVTMSSPQHICYSLLLPTTGLQVNTSSKPSEAYHYYRSPCPHLTIYLILYYYLLQVYRSTRRQNPQNHTSTTGHHVPTANYLLYFANVTRPTNYLSTCQHVVKTLRCHHLATSILLYCYLGLLQVHRSTRRLNPQNHTQLQVNMSPPHHISHFLLLPITGLQVNTSSKLPEAYHYYRSPCHHFAIYLNLYYYLLHFYRSTCRQSPKNHTLLQVAMSPPRHISHSLLPPTTGQHPVKTPKIIPLLQVTMSPPHHISFSTTTYYRSTDQHVVKALRIILYYRSTCPHLAIYLILYYYLLQVNTSSKPSEAYQYHRSPCHHLVIYLILHYYLPQVYRSTRRQNPQNQSITTGHHVNTSPYILISSTTYYRSTGQHVVKIPRFIQIPQVTMSPPRHISFSLLLPTTGLQVNTSSKPSEAYHYHRSPCPHLAIYLILYYYLPQVYRSTRRQNPQKHTITTGHHVPTSPYISFSTTTYYRSTGQHVVKTPRSISLLQVPMSPLRHIS